MLLLNLYAYKNTCRVFSDDNVYVKIHFKDFAFHFFASLITFMKKMLLRTCLSRLILFLQDIV